MSFLKNFRLLPTCSKWLLLLGIDNRTLGVLSMGAMTILRKTANSSSKDDFGPSSIPTVLKRAKMPDLPMSKLVLWMVERIRNQRQTNSSWYAGKPRPVTNRHKRRQKRDWMRTYRTKIKKELDDIMSWDCNRFIAREKSKKEKRKLAKQLKVDKKKGIY